MTFACCFNELLPLPEGVEATEFNRMLYSAEWVKAAGFDAFEVHAQYAHDFSDGELAALREVGIPVAGAICFIPARLGIYGFGEELETYVAMELEHLAVLGVKVVAFGSGGARQRPEGVSEEEHKAELCRFLRMCSTHAARHGITIAIEPLNRNECNVINTVEEAYNLACEVNLPNIRILADVYHMYRNGEDLSILGRAGEMLVHVHVADPNTRMFPGDTDCPYLCDFFATLCEIGYDGCVTIECQVPGGVGIEKAHAFLTSHLKKNR